jgi:probable HAF family extracellular repeat protein
MNKSVSVVAAVIAVEGAFVAGALGIVQYTVVDIGLSRPDQIASINNQGMVAFTAPGGAATWLNGTTTILPLGGSTSGLLAINGNGDVAGYGTGGAIAYVSGSVVSIGPVIGGGGQAVGINDSGAAAVIGPINSRAYYYHGGSATLLTPAGTGAWVAGINNAGQVCGAGQLTSSSYRAFIWQGGSFTQVTPSSVPATEFSGAYAINQLGAVAGAFDIQTINEGSQAFVRTSNGLFTILPHATDSNLNRPWSLNAANTVVGFERQVTGGWRALLWPSDGQSVIKLTDYVNAPGWIFEQATGINDAGQIVGYGTLNGVTHAFLLNPVPAPTPLMIGAAACALWAPRRRRASCPRD